jgi:hypothetical protein
MQKIKCQTCLTEMTVEPATTGPRPGEELIANRQYASASGKPGNYFLINYFQVIKVKITLLSVVQSLVVYEVKFTRFG